MGQGVTGPVTGVGQGVTGHRGSEAVSHRLLLSLLYIIEDLLLA